MVKATRAAGALTQCAWKKNTHENCNLIGRKLIFQLVVSSFKILVPLHVHMHAPFDIVFFLIWGYCGIGKQIKCLEWVYLCAYLILIIFAIRNSILMKFYSPAYMNSIRFFHCIPRLLWFVMFWDLYLIIRGSFKNRSLNPLGKMILEIF